MSERPERNIQIISENAYEAFNSLSDYIWKSPRLIESEEKLELAKLKDYFPDSIDPIENTRSMMLRRMRWRKEEHNLKTVFPDVMAVSNLFSVLSYLEFYCFQLCKEVEKNGQSKLSDTRGNGINKLFNFLRDSGIETNKISFWKQIGASIKIRNCLTHANGVVAWAQKDSVELKRIVSTGEYWCRLDGMKIKDGEANVAIISGPYGEQLKIKNDYSFLVSGHAKLFFDQVCMLAEAIQFTK